jgi:hypothetical protein
MLHRADWRTDIDCNDVGSLLGKPNRMRSPLTASRACDESNFACDTIHRLPPNHQSNFLVELLK